MDFWEPRKYRESEGDSEGGAMAFSPLKIHVDVIRRENRAFGTEVGRESRGQLAPAGPAGGCRPMLPVGRDLAPGIEFPESTAASGASAANRPGGPTMDIAWQRWHQRRDGFGPA
jgi:hypothetical protein